MTDELNILDALVKAQDGREAAVLATIIRDQGSVPRHAGSKMLVYADGRTLGSIGGGEMESRVLNAAREALADGQTRVIAYSLVDPARGDPGVCGGSVEIFIEPYLPQDRLLIFGCGHVGRALASLGKWLDFRIVVHDDRPELATADQVPDADAFFSGDLDDLLTAEPVNQRTYIAMVTRNVMVDRGLLPRLLATPAPFIGVMGSRRRWQETRRLLLEDGITDADLARVHSPIGLELNAETPAEIAVSIMAEVIMVQRGGTGEQMATAEARSAPGAD